MTFSVKNLIECDLAFDEDLAEWGKEDVAYVKRDVVNDEEVWAIYGAEGVRMGYAANRSVALALVSQNDLTAMSVH